MQPYKPLLIQLNYKRATDLISLLGADTTLPILSTHKLT